MEKTKIIKTDPDKRFRRVLAASTLTSDSVQNLAGENLGKVDELHDRHPLRQSSVRGAVLRRSSGHGEQAVRRAVERAKSG